MVMMIDEICKVNLQNEQGLSSLISHFDHGSLWLDFISANFLGQKYELISPDDFCMIKRVGGWGQD